MVREVVSGSVDLASVVMDFQVFAFTKRIGPTATICCKLDKRGRSRQRNPSLFDTKNSAYAGTTSAPAAIPGDWDRKRNSAQLRDSEKKTSAYKLKPRD